MQHEIIHTVSSGFPLRVLVEGEEWSQVEDFADRKGWVANRLLTENNSVILKVKRDSLLDGPDDNKRKIKVINYGTVLQVEDVQGSWLKVTTVDGAGGWIHKLSVWP